MHFAGRGVPQDFVLAHKWLNLVATLPHQSSETDKKFVNSARYGGRWCHYPSSPSLVLRSIGLQQRDCVGVGSLACAPATHDGTRRATHETAWSLLRSGALLRCERPKEGARVAMGLDALVFALSLTVVSLFLSLVL